MNPCLKHFCYYIHYINIKDIWYLNNYAFLPHFSCSTDFL
uniref:Uncharacterized protein n=1 Tax=Heterorhabditis bacteriophora TaxID=37862 RepID=A0A1I7WN91_HETBA